MSKWGKLASFGKGALRVADALNVPAAGAVSDAIAGRAQKQSPVMSAIMGVLIERGLLTPDLVSHPDFTVGIAALARAIDAQTPEPKVDVSGRAMDAD